MKFKLETARIIRKAAERIAEYENFRGDINAMDGTIIGEWRFIDDD